MPFTISCPQSQPIISHLHHLALLNEDHAPVPIKDETPDPAKALTKSTIEDEDEAESDDEMPLSQRRKDKGGKRDGTAIKSESDEEDDIPLVRPCMYTCLCMVAIDCSSLYLWATTVKETQEVPYSKRGKGPPLQSNRLYNINELTISLYSRLLLLLLLLLILSK